MRCMDKLKKEKASSGQETSKKAVCAPQLKKDKEQQFQRRAMKMIRGLLRGKAERPGSI